MITYNDILGVEVTLDDNCKDMSKEEIKQYVLRLLPEVKGQKLLKVTLRLEEGGENVLCDCTATTDERFERIRRITGYLVGNLGRWGNSKRAEEADRVKHSFGLT